MKKPHISLCMIVRDEGSNLSSCLESARDLVDEIIIVDTGSSDNTVKIAESYNAKVFLFPWNDDFAEARNESLKHVSGEWVLVLDADEVLDISDHERIRQLTLPGDIYGYRLDQRTYQKNSTLAGWIALDEPTPLALGCPGYISSPIVRLFRNLSDIRFKGKVHELVEHNLIAKGREIIDTDIPIHHYGKITEDDRIERKKEMYKRIGEEKVMDQPHDARSFCELGVQYIEMGMYEEAEQNLARACLLDQENIRALFNHGIALSNLGRKQEAIQKHRAVFEKDPSHIGAINNLALLLLEEGCDPEYVNNLYQKVLELNPNHHVLHFNYALFLEKTGLLQEAKKEYEKALEIDPGFEQAQTRLENLPKEKIPPEISHTHDPDTLITRGDDFLDQKRYAEALESFVSALEQEPDNADIRYRCGHTLEMLGQMDAALEQYQEAMAIDPGHEGTLLRLALEAEKQDLIDDSISLYRELLAQSPHHLEARYKLSCALETQNNIDSALGHIYRILEMDPVHSEALKKRELLENLLGQSQPIINDRPETRFKIAFLWGGAPFGGDTLQKKPLGGTESALIYMARYLAELGHDVSVFIKEGSGSFDDVIYRDIEKYLEELSQEPVDILIAARTYHPFISPVPAKIRIFWTEDAHDQHFVEPLGMADVMAGIDKIFTVSRWQTEMLSQQFNIPLEKFYITRNGVFWEDFKHLPKQRNHKKLVYTSTPFRGLDVLLDIFPRIKEQVPEAELEIYSSMAVYQVEKAEDEAMYGELYRKADQPGVKLMKSVLQSELADVLLHAGALAYPNHFAETSCIAALESMASGLPLVTSHLGALPETVSHGGILIEGDAGSEIYQEQFVDEICTLMTNEKQWQKLSTAGRNRIFDHNRWIEIAKEWIIELEQLLTEKSLTANHFSSNNGT